MDFRLLGPLEVVNARGSVDIGSRRQRVLLALLALHPNRVVSTQRILEALWGEDAVGKENAMWVAISRLRSALEPEHAAGNGSVVVTRDHGYVLAVDPDRIDVTRFEAHIELARGLSEHDPHGARHEVDEALALWRGPPIDEFAYEEFAQVEIARLEDRRLEALEMRAEAQLRLGNGREQLATLEAVHQQHPLRERFVELFMRSLYQAGRQAEALRVFDRHRRSLGDELGLDVSPELARLEEQILLHDPAVRVLRQTETIANTRAATNPFKGLRAFTEADAEDFFGRERLVSDIVRRLGTDRTLLALVGASGSGKSSTVGAGVIPALRKGALPGSEDWLIAKMIPGAHPLAELEAALLRSSLDAPDSLAEQLAGADTGLLRAALRILPDGACLVLVVDQFEELFTLVADETERVRFLDLLGPALDDPHTRVKVILTLRADFYEHPLGYPAFAQRLTDRIVNVPSLAPDEFEAAAQEPLRRAEVTMEPALLASLLTDVVGQPGALPLFQYTLTTMFDRRSSDVVTLDDYRSMGGLHGAITQRADDVMARLPVSEQAIARQLFLRLVSVGTDGAWARRRVLASELVSLPLDLVGVQHVIETFSNQRLLSSDRDHSTGSPTVEVAHEALISQWPLFRTWIEDDQHGLQMLAHLRDSSQAWELGGEDAGDLYRGARLGAALDWVETSHPILSDLETRFLAGAKDARESERQAEKQTLRHRERQNRRLRRLLAVVGTTAIVAVLLGVLALQQRQRANARTQDAVTARTVAETRRLAADAASLVDSNGQLALLMAAEAYRREPSPNTLGALQRVLLGTDNLVGHLGQTSYDRALWSPDGGSVIGLRSDGVDIFDVDSAALVTRIDIQAGSGLDVSPAGDLLAVSTSSTQLQLFNLASTEPLGRLLEHRSPVQAVRFSPDGATVATGDRSGVLRLFSTKDQQLLFEVDAHPETAFTEVNVPDDIERTAAHEPDSFPVGIRHIAFSDDGDVVATTGGLFIRTWRAGDGKALTDTQIDRPASSGVGRFVGRPTEILLRSDAEAIVRANRFIQRWNLITDELMNEYGLDTTDGSGVITSLGTLSVSIRKDRIAVSELDTVAILNTSDGAELTPPFDTQTGSTVANVDLSPDGRTVSAAGQTGIALWATDGRELLARAVPNGTAIAGPLKVSSDGRLLGLTSTNSGADQGAVIWSLDSDELTRVDLLKGPADQRLWFDLPGRVITKDPQGVLTVMDAATLDVVGPRFGPINNFNLAVSPAGHLVAAAASAPDPLLIHILDAATGEPVTEPLDLRLVDPLIDPAIDSPLSLAFNADGSRLLASTRSGAAAVFSTDTWDRIGAPISQGGGQVLDVTFSTDGRYLATSDSTGAITIRDPVSHQPLGPPLVGSTAGLTTVGFGPLAFSSDGRYLVSTADGSVRLWDVQARALIGSPIRQDGRSNAAPSLNGRWLPVNRGDRILIYDLDVSRWFAIACQAAGRNFTAAEWQQFGPADTDPQQTCPQWGQPTETEDN